MKINATQARWIWHREPLPTKVRDEGFKLIRDSRGGAAQAYNGIANILNSHYTELEQILLGFHKYPKV